MVVVVFDFFVNGFGLEPRFCCDELNEAVPLFGGVVGNGNCDGVGFESFEVCSVRGEVERFCAEVANK
jgi:hypothetical protein